MNTAKPTKQVFVLDTNILIGFSLWIPISLNTLFWSKLAEYLKKGDWILLDVVAAEIVGKGDLKKWCTQQRKDGLILPISDDDRDRAIEINNQYKMIDDATGKSVTDTYVIAYAEAKSLTVLSRESERVNENDLYKIPDVCKILKVAFERRPEVFLRAMGFTNQNV
ncbi:MAG: DUF4411 family protein [Patescibacteria group bacterium]